MKPKRKAKTPRAPLPKAIKHLLEEKDVTCEPGRFHQTWGGASTKKDGLLPSLPSNT